MLWGERGLFKLGKWFCSATMLDHIETLGWKVFAAYSPDLAPLNYHLFRPLHLADEHFNKIDETQKSIDNFIQSKPLYYFRKDMCCPKDRVKSSKMMIIILCYIKCIIVCVCVFSWINFEYHEKKLRINLYI